MKTFRYLGAFLCAAFALASVALAPVAAHAQAATNAVCYRTVQSGYSACQPAQIDFPLPMGVVPMGTPVSGASGNVANASAVATLAAATGVTNYATGFQCTAAGATAAAVVNATVTGLTGGTLTYAFAFPAGVAVGATPLMVQFANPIPATAVNTAVTVTLPAGGSGNTNASCNVQGYRLTPNG